MGHSFPQFLPGGRRFLYYVQGPTEARGVYAGELGGGEPRRLLDADAAAVYSPSGYLLFIRQGSLFAQDFDPMTMAVTGSPSLVGERVAFEPPAAALSASSGGTIAYRVGSEAGAREYVWFDQAGKELGKLATPPGDIRAAPSFAPQGRALTLHTVSDNADIWLVDVERGTFKRFTANLGACPSNRC